MNPCGNGNACICRKMVAFAVTQIGLCSKTTNMGDHKKISLKVIFTAYLNMKAKQCTATAMVVTVFEAQKPRFLTVLKKHSKYVFRDHQTNIYNQYYHVLKSS